MADSFDEVAGLLFFDTFSHEVNEDLNLDLVQFPKPVYITEVRIIPLGARVQADFPGGVRLGATNPSKFHIEFFVNDLAKPGASTFEALGDFEYNQNDCINLECHSKDARQIPTDGLVLRGWYTTITLAVYGMLTKNITEEIIVPPPVTQQMAPIAGIITAPIDATEKAVIPVEPTIEWRPDEIPNAIIPEPISAREEVYTAPASFVENYETPNYTQPVCYETHETKREVRHGRERTAVTASHDRESSESDWDRDEREELSRRREVERSPERPLSRSQTIRTESIRSYSRSTSKDRDRSSRLTSRQRSSEYRHNRYSSRSSQHDRGKKEKSRDRLDRRSLDKDYECKRPRTPPSDSPKRAKSPEKLTATSPSSACLADDHFKSNDTTKYNEKIQTIRVIDHSDRTESNQSPSVQPAEIQNTFSPAAIDDEPVEPFEPILSDEEIGEESEPQFDLDYAETEFNEEIIKTFLPGISQLECAESSLDELPRDVEIVVRLLQKYEMRDELATEDNFEQIVPESREYWVNAAEQVIQQLLVVHNYDFNRKNNILSSLAATRIQLLVSWIKLGVNFHCIMLQPQPGYKIRHLKIGARLTELLCCDSKILGHLLHQEKTNIFDLLFDLYEQKYMALSIKLMLIKAMYACLDTNVGIEYFLNEGEITGYQRLINAIKDNPLTRPKFAMKSLLKKITLYESLQLIRDTVTNLYRSNDCNTDMDVSAEMQLLRINLEEILRAYTLDELSYTQPKRFLPVASKFEIVKDLASAKNLASTFYTYFNSMSLLQSLLLLISNEDSVPECHFEICLNLIEKLAAKCDGLYLMCNNVDVTNALVKCLLELPADNPAEGYSNLLQPSTMLRKYKLGIEIAYKVKTCHLLEVITNSKYNSDTQISNVLHELYSLTCNQIGRFHVANTIGLDHNIATLINLIEKRKQQEGPRPSAADKFMGPAIGYAIDLIDLTIRLCGKLDYLEEHGHLLLDLVKNHDIFDQSISIQLQEMGIFLKPFELPNAFGYDNVSPLCDLLKRSIEFLTTFPGDLIMALRLLCHLAIPPFDTEHRPEYVELKYKFVVLQFYTNDGIGTLITILEKITNHFEQPEMHVSTLVGNQGILVTQIILPTMQILSKMLTYVIHSRNTQFKDLTAIEHLVKTYIFIYHFVGKSSAFADAQQIQRIIIETLLAYTQPSPIEGVDTESVHKSLWAQMIGELIKQILSGPRVHIPGIMMFSELLPIPLPVYTMEPLTESETIRLKTERQLWSAHLHAKSILLTELIQTTCTSNVPQLKTVLSSLCMQLADLAPNMALVVIKSIVELMLNDSGTQSSVSKQTLRLLAFILVLIHNAQIKVALISILPGKLLDYLCGILVANTTSLHGRAQELILQMFVVLLNPHIAVVPPEKPGNSGIAFTSALPSKDILPLMISGVVEVFTLPETTNVCREFAIKTLDTMAAIDYTLFLLRAVLEKKKDSLRAVIEKILNWEIADNHSLTMAIIDFLFNLLQNSKCNLSEYRSISLRPVDVASIIGWPASTEDKPHFFLTLQTQMKEIVDDAQVTDTLNTLTKLIDALNVSPVDDTDLTEPLYPPAEGIVAQYSARSIFFLTNRYIEPELNCPTLVGEDSAADDRISIDLCELIKTNLPPELNVISECKRLLHLSASPQSNRERTTTAPCFRTRRVEVEPSTGRPEKKIYVTRGRGFPRTPPTRGDLFRSRPPNTSRPPSLHVDDFLALETCGAQPTGPTGYNKLSRDIIGIRGSRGGRGRGFGGDRGRISSLPSGATSDWGLCLQK